MNNKQNLKTIVLWWLGTFIAFILIVFNIIFYNIIKHSFYNRVSNSLSVVSNRVKDEFLPINPQNKIVTIPQKLDFPISPVMVAVFGAKNMNIVAKTVTFMDIKMYKYLKSKNNFFVIKTKRYGKMALFISKIISPIKGYIVVATPMRKVDIKLQDILFKMITLNPILLILILLGANFILDRILEPIKNITKVANEISVGKLDRTIPIPHQQDEIQELVKAFNAMVIRLKSGIETMKRFNSDVSHELKTPLTVLKGELELSLRKNRDEEYYKNTIKIALDEVNHLIDMVEEMLVLTKIENEVDLKGECLNVDEILLEVIAKLAKKAKSKNVNLNISKLDTVQLNSNPILIKTVFVNIIDNAIKYTPPQKNIFISLCKTDNKIVFEVEDEGIGIKKEEIDKITKRFYRSEESRNRNVQGFGLGLSIVLKAIEVLGAKFDITSKKDQGTKVRIVFENV